jgi:hypothetical protein
MASINLIEKRISRKTSIPADEILLAKIADIVMNEHRPVSYKDLQSFEWNGQLIIYSHGTLRNKFSRLCRQNMIELLCRSPQAFYTLPGVKFGKVMTPYSIVDNIVLTHKQREFLKTLNILELNNPAIHDIRLWFSCEGFREIILQSNSDLIEHIDEKSNKNIYLKKITLSDITLTIVIHNKDSVSVEITCSDKPIPVDIIGLPLLTSLLTRVEERLQGIINEYKKTTSLPANTNEAIIVTIPNHMSWIVKMWHFGYDSEPRLNGDKFELTWKESLETFRVYSKKRKTYKG